MKLSFFACLALFLLSFSSKAQHTEGRQNIPKDRINQMIAHYGNSRVPKKGFIVEFTRDSLIKFLQESPDPKVRIFVVAYPEDHNRNIVVLSTDGTLKTKYSSYQGTVICPPPRTGICVIQ